MEPVSYTHLDVYKRQALSVAQALNVAGAPHAPLVARVARALNVAQASLPELAWNALPVQREVRAQRAVPERFAPFASPDELRSLRLWALHGSQAQRAAEPQPLSLIHI